jgi:dihydropteroate synthase
MSWKTARRSVPLDRPLVMGILNVTPDSFSDGGRFATRKAAAEHAERMIAEGADIIDIGGESTRPGSEPVATMAEVERVVPVIEDLAERFDVPISIDTTKAEVARRAIEAGAEIVNDISGLRWEPELANVAADAGAGLVLMHSRGTFETMHSQPPVNEIVDKVIAGLKSSIREAKVRGVDDAQIAVDVGIGFGKTAEQNLELLAKLDRIVAEFEIYPLAVGTSRKSFLAKVLGDIPANERLGGSLASALLSLSMGARIVRVHDVKETVAAIKVLSAIRSQG